MRKTMQFKAELVVIRPERGQKKEGWEKGEEKKRRGWPVMS